MMIYHGSNTIIKNPDAEHSFRLLIYESYYEV